MRRMKFGKIQKFSVASNIWLKIETFDHSGPAKDEIWQHLEILSCFENLAQKSDFWPLQTCEGWNMAKSRYFQSRWKFGLQSRFWPLLTCEGWNFAKSRNFDSCQKFCSQLTFLTTLDMQRMKCGKIQKFSIAIKIKPKIESFDHSGHAKDEIWQNPEIFSLAANLAKKWECWPLWTSKGWNLTKSRKILICVENLAQKIDFDHSRPAKDEIWQNPDIFSRVENLAWNREFDYSWPAKDDILQSQHIHVKNLTQNWHFWPLATCEGWNLAKSRNFQLRQTFGSKLRLLTTLDLQRMKFDNI